MKKIIFISLLVFSLIACSKKDMEQKGSYLAKVGDVRITQADFDREFQTLPDYAQKMFENTGGKEKFLDEIIKKEVLYQEAVKKGFDKSADFLKKMEDFKKLTLITDLFEKEIMAKAKVTEQETKDFYEKHKEEFIPTSQIKASHILVKTEDEANKVLALLKKGEKFEKIAKSVSIDKVSAKNGGDLGYFSKGQMVPEFEKAASALNTGEISNPVKTSYGYHIIKVTDKKAGPVVEFDRVKDMIMQKLSGNKQKDVFDNYISELKKNYKIDINKDALTKIPQTNGNTERAAPVPSEQSATGKPAESKETPVK